MAKRKVEIFSAGCAICEDTIRRVKDLACSSCEVEVMSMQDSHVSERARQLGIRSIPAVAIEGQLVECCVGVGPNEKSLKAAGLGQPL